METGDSAAAPASEPASAPTETSSAPATETPAPVNERTSYSSSTSFTEPPKDKPSAREKKQDEWFAKKGLAEKPAKPDADAKAAPPAKESKPTTYEGAKPDEVSTLKRFHVSPSTWSKLDQDERTTLLKSFAGHVSYTSKIDGELAELRKAAQGKQSAPAQQPAPEQRQQQTEPPPAAGQHWKGLESELDPKLLGDFRSAVMGELQPVLAELQQYRTMLADLGARMWEDDVDRSFSSLELPEGVDASDEAIRNAILDAARQQIDLSDGQLFSQRKLLKAVKDAAAALYQHQKDAAQARRIPVAPHTRGAPERRPPTTRTVPTREQAQDLYFKGMQAGLKGEALREFVRAGGRPAAAR